MRIVLSFLAALAFLSSPLTALAQANNGTVRISVYGLSC